MKKNHVVDSNKKALKSQRGDERKLMLSEEVVDEEGNPMVVENDKPQGDPIPTAKVPPSIPQRLKKEGNAKFKTFLAKLGDL